MSGKYILALVFAFCCAVGLTTAATADETTGAESQAWVNTVTGMLNVCMHVGSNRLTNAAAAWGRESYFYKKTDLSEADKLNGFEASGEIELRVPTKMADTTWKDGVYHFDVVKKNGESSISPASGAAHIGYDIINPYFWDCSFRNNVRLPPRWLRSDRWLNVECANETPDNHIDHLGPTLALKLEKEKPRFVGDYAGWAYDSEGRAGGYLELEASYHWVVAPYSFDLDKTTLELKVENSSTFKYQCNKSS